MIFWLVAAGLTAFTVRILLRSLPRESRTGRLLLAGIPLAALGLYFLLGRPELADKSSKPQLPPFLTRTVAKLEAAVKADPGDVFSWQLLGDVDAKLKRWPQAVMAYRQAVAHAPERGDLQLALAVGLVETANGKVGPEALELFHQQAAEPLARYYEAQAAAQKGNWESALQQWQDLQASTPPDAPYQPQLAARIAEAKQALELDQ